MCNNYCYFVYINWTTESSYFVSVIKEYTVHMPNKAVRSTQIYNKEVRGTERGRGISPLSLIVKHNTNRVLTSVKVIQ